MKTQLLTAMLLLWQMVAFAQPTKDVCKQRINIINKNIYNGFYDEKAGLFIETNDSNKNDHPHSYLWPLCALIQAANEADKARNTNTYMVPVVNAIKQYYTTEPPAPGYQAVAIKEKKDTRFYDDNQWIAIAYLDAYNRTGTKHYLDESKEIYNFMMHGYDTAGGGGLYWKEDDKTTKNTCSNAPGVLVALQLYNITKQQQYLDTALLLYDWVNAHLQSADGLFYDNIKLPSMKVDSALYTYNTGTVLQANVLLYSFTKNKKYLLEANRIAAAAKMHFYKNNKLPGNYWFNVVLLRGFVELYATTRDKQYVQLFINDAERVWKDEKDAHDLVGDKPTKTLIDQAAMMEIFARLAVLD